MSLIYDFAAINKAMQPDSTARGDARPCCRVCGVALHDCEPPLPRLVTCIDCGAVNSVESETTWGC